MEKIENIEIKKYIIDFVRAQLEQCKIFTKVFGKGFVLRSLKRNLTAVYTNEFNENMAAYYSSINKDITFCTDKENSKILTLTDVKGSKNIKSIILHEGIHAVLNRSKFDCQISGLTYSTGILEVTKHGKECGRGLNEGVTNWICEKSGIKRTTYVEETNFVKQLELALGPTAIMKMARGRIKTNVSKQLQMTPKECYAFLGLIDEVYYTKTEISNYQILETILTRYMNKQSYSSEETEKIQKTFEDMKLSNEEYFYMQQSLPYLDFVIEEGYSLENELKFLKQLIDQDTIKLNRVIAEVESTIFDRYFKKDFENIVASGNISKKEYIRYMKLGRLMSTDVTDEKLEQYSSSIFLKNFEQIFKQLTKSKSKQFRESYRIALPSQSCEMINTKDNIMRKNNQLTR